MLNGLDPDQARHFVEPDLGQNRSAEPFLQAKQSTQVQITKNLCINGGYSMGDITRASSGLDPDQARHFVGPDLGPNRSS